MLALSALLRRPVVDREGEELGRLEDLAVHLADAYPAVTRIRVRARRRQLEVGWGSVESIGADGVRLGVARGDLRSEPLREDELLLAHHVVDTQVFDVAGRRLTRVEDVQLARDGRDLRLAGLEVGTGAMLRRLGLGRLGRRSGSKLVDWGELQLATGRGFALHLRSEAGGLRRLSPTALAELASRLPLERGAEALRAAGPDRAAGALSAVTPRLSAGLVGALATEGPQILARMPLDDAVAALRHLDRADLEQVLAAVPSERAGALRRLLAYPPRTAAGLMSPDVLTARAGEPLESIRERLAKARPELESLATLFVLDAAGRVTGALRPTDLIAGDVTPHRVPTLHVATSVEEVVDIFALTDALALPVVDDDGQLVGAVAVDDVLEELLLERLPGRRRFRFLRRHAPA